MLDEPSTLSPATSHLISDYSLLLVHAMITEVVATNRSRGDVATQEVVYGLKSLLSPVFEPIPFSETGVGILVTNLQYHKRLPDRIPRQKADITEWWRNLLCELQAMQLFAIGQRDEHNLKGTLTPTMMRKGIEERSSIQPRLSRVQSANVQKGESQDPHASWYLDDIDDAWQDIDPKGSSLQSNSNDSVTRQSGTQNERLTINSCNSSILNAERCEPIEPNNAREHLKPVSPTSIAELSECSTKLWEERGRIESSYSNFYGTEQGVPESWFDEEICSLRKYFQS